MQTMRQYQIRKHIFALQAQHNTKMFAETIWQHVLFLNKQIQEPNIQTEKSKSCLKKFTEVQTKTKHDNIIKMANVQDQCRGHRPKHYRFGY